MAFLKKKKANFSHLWCTTRIHWQMYHQSHRREKNWLCPWRMLQFPGSRVSPWSAYLQVASDQRRNFISHLCMPGNYHAWEN